MPDPSPTFFPTPAKFRAWLRKHHAKTDHAHDHDDHGAQKKHDEHTDHDAHKHDHHGHEEQDPHVWTSPVLVKHMIGNIRDRLTELAPAHAQAFARNHDAYAAELDKLDRELHARLDPLPNRRFMVFHPAWGYFADSYGLTQVSIEREYNGKMHGVFTNYLLQGIDGGAASTGGTIMQL